jgi:hypothetical protein
MKLKMFLLSGIMILILVNCVIVKEMIPQKPTTSVSPFDLNPIPKENFIPDTRIGMEFFFVKGYDEPHTPPNVKPTKALESFLAETTGSSDLNRSGVVRFYDREKPSKRIMIILPGIYSGAGTLANLAKAIVRRNVETEVWIWERRANQLEDRRLLNRALKEKNPKLLYNILEPGTLNIKKGSFYQPSKEDISFVGYWGLEVQLHDAYNVVKEAKKRSGEVVLAGYSLGVLYTTLFLANNFGTKEKPEAGYSLVDKAILFDGPPQVEGYVTSENIYDAGVYIIPPNLVDGKKDLESGKVYPCNGSVDRDMSMFYKFDLKAVLAIIAPDKLSPEPYNYLGRKMPITNYAQYMLGTDDNYSFFKLFTATVGRADAQHFGKFNYDDSVTITGLTKGKDKIDWIMRKEGDKTEFNNPDDYLWAANTDYFDMPEWYQPTRILLDLGSIHYNDTTNGWQSKYFNITENEKINVPMLCIGLSRGLSSRIDIYQNYRKMVSSKNFTILMINSLTHLDGDTMTDNGTRQYIADTAVNWLTGRKLLATDINNGALYMEK